MKKNNMQTTSTIAKVFDTVLSIPGMNDNVKNSINYSTQKCFAFK
jgi:hypothetical protein